MGDKETKTEIENRDADHSADLYEIRLKGVLDARWADWFDRFAITQTADGDTLLIGPVVDQAALHGVLKKIRDIGIPLHSVNQRR